MEVFGFTISKKKENCFAEVEEFLNRKGLRPNIQKFDGNRMYSIEFDTEKQKRDFEKNLKDNFPDLLK